MQKKTRPKSIKKKYYTYNLLVSFTMQFTFPEDETEPSEEGDPTDRDPSQRSLENLTKELREYLEKDYWPISNLDVDCDFDDLLGIAEE